jgi:2-polyprenyl-6-methoxyphenol hydroxylase-like FAD-dependent oxidoreductase
MTVRGREHTPVLIVGAGPVGAIAALTLARHQVPSVVIERSMHPSVHPKMDFINARTMELLRQLGLADAVREIGIASHHSTDFLWTRGFAEPPVMVWHQPSVDEMRRQFSAINDGTAPVEPYQRVLGSLLERLLRQAMVDHPLIELRCGHSFADVEQAADGLTVTVVDRTDAARHAVTVDYLVGCDGARSAVRRCLGIEQEESGAATAFCSVYFRSHDPVLRRYGRAFLTIAAAGLNLVSRDEDALWTASFPTGEQGLFVTDPIAVVQQRLGVPFAVDEIISVAHWEGELAVASAYRKGRAFLAGDAAHHFYPAGAHGVNTGVGDAVDLGWKLAATLNGWGGPALLDSYEAERRPVAVFNRELCAELLEVGRRFSRLAAAGISSEHLAGLLEVQAHQIDNLGVHFGHRYTDSPVIAAEKGDPPQWTWREVTGSTWPGGRAPSVRLSSGEQLFDRLGTSFTLVDVSGSGLGADLVGQAAMRGIPMTYLALDDPAVRACYERDLVLVRPDHYVAWRADHVPENWGDIVNTVTGRRTARAEPDPAILL